MLPGAKWRSEAVVRLLLSIIVCIYGGSVISVATQLVRSDEPGMALQFGIAVLALVCLGTCLWLINAEWRIETVMRRLAAVLTLFYAALFAGAWLQKGAGSAGVSTLQMLIAALSFQGACLLLVWRLLRQQRTTWTDMFGLANNPHPSILAGILVAALFLPLGWTLQQASGLLLQHLTQFGLGPEEQQSIHTLRMANSLGQRTWLAVVTIGLAPLGEELLFRGILYAWVKQLGWPRLALWGTSLLFASVHFNALTLIPLLALSVVLTLLYERTANLLSPIAAHSFFNGLNFGMLYWFSL
jgi:membrane protease YdiL (CAAX protease family)